MWWIAAAFAQEQPQEHLFAWRRYEESGRIESIWVEPDGDVHRIEGLVTVVDDVAWKWVSLPYTEIGSRCGYVSAHGGPASDLELYEDTRDVLLPFGRRGRVGLTAFTDDLDGEVGSSVVPFAQMGPWLFVERSVTRIPCGSSGPSRVEHTIEGPIYDLRKASTIRVEDWIVSVEAAAADARVVMFGDGLEVAPYRKPPEPARWAPTWDEGGDLKVDLVMDTGSRAFGGDEWLGARQAVVLSGAVPEPLLPWSAPPEPIASFLAGHRGGWSRSELYEPVDDFVRGTFDVAPATAR